jgi:glycolate oxidase iron-sulfur subunit
MGKETDSPRGRIYLMKNVAEGRLMLPGNVARHLDLCLGCLACETACPSGVRYGQIMDKARCVVRERCSRPVTERLLRYFMANVMPYPARLEVALLPVRMLQAVGLGGLLERPWFQRLFPSPARPMLSLVPDLPPMSVRHTLGETIPAEGTRRYRVALLTGCVMSVMFSRTHETTLRVLTRNGCEVIVPAGQACCGALHMHLGQEKEARDLARRNLHAFPVDEVDAILSNAAGCGAMLKTYGDLFADDPVYAARAAAFAAKARDISEFLASIELNVELGEIRVRATYDDPCHLIHAQQIRDEPRRLLGRIPGLELVPLPESEMCCGSAGPYNLIQPAMADRLLRRKVAHILGTGARMVITGNPGCLLQIRAGLRRAGADLEVIHTIDLLDRAYRAAGRK